MPTANANANEAAAASAHTDALKQIQEAWDAARQQLADLREAVERHGELAELKSQGDTLSREMDRAYRDLGEAVWSAVKKGNLELPPSLAQAAKGIELCEKKQAIRASSIQDLLAEGTEVARVRAAEKKQAAETKSLASRGKKR